MTATVVIEVMMTEELDQRNGLRVVKYKDIVRSSACGVLNEALHRKRKSRIGNNIIRWYPFIAVFLYRAKTDSERDILRPRHDIDYAR